MLIETVQDLIKDVDGVCSVVIDSTWSDEKIFINEDKIMSCKHYKTLDFMETVCRI